MATSKPKVKTFTLQNYRCVIHVGYHKSLGLDEIFNNMPDTAMVLSDPCGEDDVAYTVCIEETRTIYLVFGNRSSLSDISHECIHAATSIFDMISTSHNTETDELYAYLHTYLFERTCKFLFKDCKVSAKAKIDELGEIIES